MTLAIVTDSTSYLTEDEVKKFNINVMPIPVIIDNKMYKEGVDFTTDEFYDLLASSAEFPKTSQPATGEWLELFEQLKADGYDEALVISLSSTISGTVNTVASLENAIDGFKVHSYDSKLTVRIMGLLVLKAAQMAEAGKSMDEILTVLNQLTPTIDEYFVVDDLQNLARGGRLSNASAILGSMLRVKPILTFDNESNYIVPFEKVRSMKKALGRAEDLFVQAKEEADYPLHGLVVHGNSLEAGEKFRDAMQEKYPDVPFDLSYFGPVIGTHLGSGAIALAWLREPDSL
ncbi:DegV family protein [Weissella tructae]